MQSMVIVYYIVSVWNVSVITPFYSGSVYSNYIDPVPQVLMLTAIVVGFATTALGLAIVIRIKRKYGTIMYSEMEDNNEEEEKNQQQTTTQSKERL